MIIAASLDNPLCQKLIYLKAGKFKCNNVSCLQFLNEALLNIKSNFTKVKLIVSDAVKYNLTARKKLLKKHEHIRWITCYSHLIHNCCTHIADHFYVEKKFISLMNDLFQSSDSYDYMLYDNIKPPEVFPTRWGSFLKAVEYYKQNFKYISEFLKSADFKTKPVEIKRYIILFKLIETFTKKCNISRCYGHLQRLITSTERKGFSILEAGESFSTINFHNDPVIISSYFKKGLKKMNYQCYFLKRKLLKIAESLITHLHQ